MEEVSIIQECFGYVTKGAILTPCPALTQLCQRSLCCFLQWSRSHGGPSRIQNPEQTGRGCLCPQRGAGGVFGHPKGWSPGSISSSPGKSSRSSFWLSTKPVAAPRSSLHPLLILPAPSAPLGVPPSVEHAKEGPASIAGWGWVSMPTGKLLLLFF